MHRSRGVSHPRATPREAVACLTRRPPLTRLVRNSGDLKRDARDWLETRFSFFFSEASANFLPRRLLTAAFLRAAATEYRLVAKKGEGTFSEGLKAQCIKNGKYVAIKCMKNHFDSLDQVNNLREIQALRRLSPHGNIIKLLEVLYDQPTGRLALGV